MNKMILLFASAILLIALAIHALDMMFKPKILVFREGGYECVTLRGSAGASCYKVEQ